MKLLRLPIALLTLLLMLAAAPALAEDVYVVKDAAAAGSLSTDCSYLRVCCPLSGESPVTLSIRDGWGYLVYQRDYGACRGTFRSEDVYLPLEGASTRYNVTLSCGGSVHEFSVTRVAPRLTDSHVTACGLSLTDVTGKRDNRFAVIIDAWALEGSTLTVPLVSGGMQVGYASITVSGGEVTVSAALTVDGKIEKSTVYVARDAVTAATLGANRFTGVKTKLNRAADLGGTPYAAILVQLTVSYDAATAQPFREDPWFSQEQQDLWEMMLLTTASEAVG